MHSHAHTSRHHVHPESHKPHHVRLGELVWLVFSFVIATFLGGLFLAIPFGLLLYFGVRNTALTRTWPWFLRQHPVTRTILIVALLVVTKFVLVLLIGLTGGM